MSYGVNKHKNILKGDLLNILQQCWSKADQNKQEKKGKEREVRWGCIKFLKCCDTF